MSGTGMDPELHAAAMAERVDALRAPKVRTPIPTFDLAHCYGPVGDFVRLWEPHTEAAPVALYSAILAMLGALIGRGPMWLFGSVEHHVRLFVLLIGPTGAGRKGTALAIARWLIKQIDADFEQTRRVSGLSSAEGLIAEIRDGTPDREVNGKVIPGDNGVDDKRLLVVEGEMGGPLEAMAREGNRLSAAVRDFWDGADAGTLTKHTPQRTTKPHVVIVGAITSGELKKLLSNTAVVNGLANRFFPIWSTRARLLAEDSHPDDYALAAIVRTISTNIDTARTVSTVGWTDGAAARWHHEYSGLAITDDPSDTVRALLERGAPYVRRVAMLLALLDGTGQVGVLHLEAALHLWEYAAGTWRTVYHDAASRSPLAEALLVALSDAGAAGLTRTAMREDVTGCKHVEARTIDAALDELAGSGLAIKSKEPTDGRPRERWQHGRYVGATAPGEKGEKGENPPAPTPSGAFSPFPPFSPPPGPLVLVTMKSGGAIELPADSPDLSDPGTLALIARIEPVERAA